jgi:hypothetical protein
MMRGCGTRALISGNCGAAPIFNSSVDGTVRSVSHLLRRRSVPRHPSSATNGLSTGALSPCRATYRYESPRARRPACPVGRASTCP